MDGDAFCFHFSRLLEGCINHDINGEVKVYVDDLCGCSALDVSENDQTLSSNVCTGLLGDNALAEDKHEVGRRLDMIGWSFDLNLKTVSVSYNNHLKTVYCVFQFQRDGKYHLSAWQTVAARASRYVAVCPHMKPFTAALHRMCSSFLDNTNIVKSITPEAWQDLQMWKTFLCLLLPFESTLARKLSSFQPEEATIRIEFDASLTGAGIVISKRDGSNTPWQTATHTGLIFPFSDLSKTDSSFQNSCEFIAVVVALYCLCRLDFTDVGYELIGDSRTALSWCKRGSAKSPLAWKASIAFSLLCIYGNLRLQTTTHVPGKENVVCDGLSRGGNGADFHLPAHSVVPVALLDEIKQLLTLINPCFSQVQDLEAQYAICSFLQSKLKVIQPLRCVGKS